jgi:pimeloyl-ACP methyl ester carboxylesterase
MKNLIKIFILILVFITTSNLFSQSAAKGYGDRAILWVHGFQGSVNSWKVYEGYTNLKYKIQSMPVSYNSNLGFNSGATQILNLGLPTPQESAKPHIMVGHSWGGLVGRALVSQSPKTVGGYITVGAPHNGAKAMNAQTTKLLVDKIIKMVDAVVKHPLVQIAVAILPKWLLSDFQSFITDFDDFKGQINTALGAYMGSITSGQITQGNAGLADLGFGPEGMPKIAIAGIENYPEHLRWMSSWTWSPSSHGINQVNDGDLINTLNKVKAKKAKFFKVLDWLSFFSSSSVKQIAADLKNKVNVAMDYVDNQFYDDWMDHIGALSLTSSTQTIYTPIGKGKYSTTTKTIITKTVEPNDGLILKSSALALPGACKYLIADGANHQEELNHPSMTKNFDDILQDKSSCNGFFFTPLR